MRTSNRLPRRLVKGLLALTLAGTPAFAQRPPDIKLTPDANRQVVNGVMRALKKYYVSAEVAERVNQRLSQRLKNGEYEKITSAFDLIDALDSHMQEASKDKHLALAYSHVAEPLDERQDFRS